MQLKLDELIRAVRAARTELVRMEALTDEELIMDPCFKTTQ
jgi:low affinity Fe/Cu permease